LPAADFLLFGHTHVPRDEQVGDCRLLNPGTIGKPNKGSPPSWAWLEIIENGEVSWSLNSL
jgi:predicted phosphodiesterase